ncbi:MAG: sialate O-acetylesterase [Verrucomicrobia bacterium]|nr:sialate O-acetylesterase [Verrucomicrobiota bacterium]
MKTPGYLLLAFGLALAPALRAELKLPAIIGDHMVLQQKQSNPIWGWDTPGTKISVRFAGQSHAATAGGDGRWTVKLAPVAANATPQTLTIAGSTKRMIQDVLVGEVWMCSGQSNMGFKLNGDWNGDLEAAASKLPNLRLISVPQVGTQELQNDFKGQWRASTPDSAKSFSAVGFLYGRYIHEIVGVPVGLIDNAWGGSAAEAWVRRESLERDPRFKLLMENTVKREAQLESAQGKANQEEALAKWKADVEKAKAEKKAPPRAPQSWLAGNARPGNIFNGIVHPTLGYGMKGVIWYQGESNAGRAYEHADLFPFMIEQWRKEWRQGDFSFYWVQLADFRAEKASPGESDWAELRETQTRTMRLPNTGQAVIIDLGEGRDIHPRNKHDVAARLVRWALAKDYGMKLPYRSPEFKSLALDGNKATVTLDCFGSSLRPFDVADAVGFALCGEDRVWHWAAGKIVGKDRVEVWSEKVAAPIAVRYAWADNPVCNLFSEDGLPVTPFRTDDFEMITKPKT